jgi:hypothetical protein
VLILPNAAQAASPTCPDGDFTTLPGQVLALPGNPCSDPDGDPLTLAIVGPGPQNGVLTLQAGSFSYQPDAGFVGIDTFQYKALESDETTASNIATVRIVVDTAPTCSDFSATVQTDQVLTLSDFPCDDVDPDDTLDILLDDPHSGRLDFAPSGDSVTYTPNPGFVGTDSLTFSSDDGRLESDTATLTITVTALPEPAPALPAPALPTPALPPPVPAAPAKDTTAPSLALAGTGAQTIRSVIAGGLKLDAKTNESGSLRLTVQADRATARKLGLDRKAKGPVTVGRLNRQIPSGRTKLVVKLTAKARKALKQARKVTLKVNLKVTDAAGNATTRSLTMKLKG